MAIYAIKSPEDDGKKRELYESLRGGEGRFGWSYVETADLRKLKERIDRDGWDSLTDEEKECYNSSRFLLELQDGGYVVYINLPEWGQCTLARVTGTYGFRYENDDFNHRFPVDPESVRSFDRNDDMVPPALCARLKLPGAWWRISTEAEFYELLESLNQGTEPAPRTSETNLRHLSKCIKKPLLEIAGCIYRAHPNTDLEGLLEETFKNVPGVRAVKRHRGRDDHGADLEVEYDIVPGFVQSLVVQVKSYEGELGNRSAVEDIKRAFNAYPNASMGLIVSTATTVSQEVRSWLDRLGEDSGKTVGLLIGDALAAFILRYGPVILRYGPDLNGK